MKKGLERVEIKTILEMIIYMYLFGVLLRGDLRGALYAVQSTRYILHGAIDFYLSAVGHDSSIGGCVCHSIL